MTKVRILRVLEYIGDQNLIEDALDKRGVKGMRESIGYVIREGIIGEFPEVLEESEEEK